MEPKPGHGPPAHLIEGGSGPEEPYRMLIRLMGHGFAHCLLICEGGRAVDWVYLEVNPAFETWTGLRDVTGKKVSEVLPHLRETSPDVFEIYERVVRTGVPEQFETFVKDLDAWLAIRVFSPGVGEFVATFENISDRKWAEVAQRESEEKWHLLTDELQIGVLTQSPTSAILQSNPKALELLGLSLDQLLGKTSIDPDWNVIHEDGTAFPGPTHPVPQAIATQASVRKVVMGVYRPATQDRVWLLVDAIPQLNADRSLRQVVCTFSDITEIKQSEGRLKAALTEAQRLRGALDLVAAHVYMKDPQSRYLYANQSTLRLFGCSTEELVGADDSRFFPRATVKRLHEIDARVFRGERTSEEIDVADAAGGRRVYLEAKTPIYAGPEPGTVLGLLGISTDITERKRMEEALRESEARFSSMAENSPVAIYRYSDRRGGLYYSPRTLELLGHTPEALLADPRLWHDSIHPEDRPGVDAAMAAALSGQSGLDLSYRIRHASGQQRWFRDRALSYRLPSGEVIVDGVAMDVTDLRKAEDDRRTLQAQVDHLQHLEGIGQLAGGVAHELNNALASIMAVSSLLQRRGDEVAAMAELILQASCRGRDVVKALLDFSRKDLQGATLVDLNDLVARQAALLTSTTRHAIRIVQDLQPGLPWILAGESALGSVVMKLALNAVEAMPSGGTLTLKTRALPEDGVTLSVEDTGQGMSEAVRVRAMEPFFTTKPFGQGTGLGLSTVHGIVRAHGGTLEIRSAPGLGTQVLLSLPAAPDQSAPA